MNDEIFNLCLDLVIPLISITCLLEDNSHIY